MKKFIILFTKTALVSTIFLLIAVVLIVCVGGITGNGNTKEINQIKNLPNSPFQSSLTRGRFALIKSIVDDNTLIIDKYATTTFPDIIYNNGHYYSVFIPGTALLASPFYALGEKFNNGVLTTNLFGPISILLTVLVMFCTLRMLHLKLGVTLLSVFLMVFATDLFTYSTTLNAHYLSALSVALALSATVLVLAKNQWAIGYPMFWLAFGLGIMVDYPNALTLLPFAITLFFHTIHIVQKNDKSYVKFNSFLILSSLTALLFILPLLLYVYTVFGTYFTTIEPHQINGVYEHGKVNYHLADNPQFYLNKKIQYKTLSLNEQYIPLGFFTNLFSPARGLFIYSSVLLLSFLGIKILFKKNRNLLIAICSSILITIVVYSAYADYAGGWAYGPRFLIGIMPLFATLLAFAIQRYIRRTIFLIIFTVTSLYSIAISSIGTITTKLLVSPIESNQWGFNNSFIQNISQINTEKYVSFIYDYYLKKIFSKEQFALTLIATLFSGILFLIITTIIQSERQDLV